MSGLLRICTAGSVDDGKSTLIGALTAEMRKADREVAVLSIDPSSPFTRGALLGDRIRLSDHFLDAGVFIRSMATRGHLGGLSVATPQAARVLDAIGTPWIVIETVGVGQVEVEIAGHADTTIVVVNPGWGDAVQAAKKAFPAWSRTPAAERSKLLLTLADLIEQNLDELARTEAIDSGKPLSLATMLDIPRAVANFRFFATAILHASSDAHITDAAAINYTLRQPLGVVGLISPWNLPLLLMTWKAGPALACGNTVVVKPSEVTPSTATLLGEVMNDVGVPEGVYNVVHGFGETGAMITSHPDVDGITGQYFYQCKVAKPSKAALDDATAARLWDVSAEMTDLS